ncbi:MAG: hypothetical protein H7288_05760 [Kineosporiaceae bacterium]|nr:hypothetical protein [Aeromicrobium sp.]
MMLAKCLPRSDSAKLAVILFCAAITCLSACTGSDDVPEPTLAGPTVTTSTEATPTPDRSWEKQFTAAQLAAYGEALGRLTAYQSEVIPIWSAGKATPEAKKLFMTYFVPWQLYYGQLEQYEKADIRLDVRDRVIDSRATRAKVASGSSSVSIRQCVDQTATTGTQGGEMLPKASTTPQLVDVVLSQADGRWLITSISNSSKDRPCAV